MDGFETVFPRVIRSSRDARSVSQQQNPNNKEFAKKLIRLHNSLVLHICTTGWWRRPWTNCNNYHSQWNTNSPFENERVSPLVNWTKLCNYYILLFFYQETYCTPLYFHFLWWRRKRNCCGGTKKLRLRSKDWNMILSNFHRQGHANCYYQGEVDEHPDWIVVMNTCGGLT